MGVQRPPPPPKTAAEIRLSDGDRRRPRRLAPGESVINC
jgi:hypothetical protein